jgi:hypothetical protein
VSNSTSGSHQEKYGQAAVRAPRADDRAAEPVRFSKGCDPITSNLYDSAQAGQIPEEALRASLGCGNPTALAQLSPGEVCSIWAREEESTFCFPPGASAPRQGVRAGHDARCSLSLVRIGKGRHSKRGVPQGEIETFRFLTTRSTSFQTAW